MKLDVRLAAILCLLSSVPCLPGFAQSSGDSRSIPSEADLRRMNKAATPAEAAPLIKELDEAKEAHFQARRAARLQMQGKTDAARLKIWTDMLATEQKRRERIRELEFKTDQIRKQEFEKNRSTDRKEGGK